MKQGLQFGQPFVLRWYDQLRSLEIQVRTCEEVTTSCL